MVEENGPTEEHTSGEGSGGTGGNGFNRRNGENGDERRLRNRCPSFVFVGFVPSLWTRCLRSPREPGWV